ncbi:MAG: DUF4132 domain-containing protein [Ruminococcaceae bacterium]|nr:DUF4132 domain-containing protein [Oscillospiraceae bacterium]
MSDIGDFVIENGVLKKYTGKETEVGIPEGVTKIGDRCFANSTKIKTVTIPKTVKKIGAFAFINCTTLDTIVFCGGNIVFLLAAFYGCNALKSIEITDINNWVTCSFENIQANPLCYAKKFLINGSEVEDVTVTTNIKSLSDYIFYNCNSLKSIVLPENLQSIGESAFYSCSSLQKIVLPDSVVKFGKNVFENCKAKINVPQNFIRQKKDLPATSIAIIKQYFKTQLTIIDSIWLYFYQKSDELILIAKDVLMQSPSDAVKEMISFLENEKISTDMVECFGEFVFEYKTNLETDLLERSVEFLKSNNSTTWCDKIGSFIDSTSGNSIKEFSIDSFCNENFKNSDFHEILKKMPFDFSLCEVHYKNSNEVASEFLIKCALVPYFTSQEKKREIAGYKTDFNHISFNPNADTVIENLNKEDLTNLILKNSTTTNMYKAQYLLAPLCRVCDGKTVSKIVSDMRSWSQWYSYAANGRSAIIMARSALLLNDSREAMLYTDKCNGLKYYALIRNLDEDYLRDNVLSDFGFDDNGLMYYDLGATIIEVCISKDLSISLFDKTANKECKSLPKRNSDSVKYEQASAALSDLKKNVKKVVKARNDMLFNLFLSGDTIKFEKWQNSYLKNIILHRVAELIVWEQEDKTFILSKNGPIDCNGNPYTIVSKSNIKVAHPMEMDSATVKNWQQYFTSNSLKQPFEQIWEPVINFDSIDKNRYSGINIPYYRFLDKSSIGIFVEDYDYHNEIAINFEDCSAKVVRIDWQRHAIERTDNFEIRCFSVNEKTRKTNHIVSYLDRITVYGRILKDDISIVDYLEVFTLAQITEFINLASENNCTNVVAALLNYKKEQYSDFDPMAEFVL